MEGFKFRIPQPTEKPVKSARIVITASPEQVRYITRAAELAQVSRSEWILQASIQMSRQYLDDDN